jgi:hypothetical protein
MTNNTHFETPIFPKVIERGNSGLMQVRSKRCSGILIQSSQNDFGHFGPDYTTMEYNTKDMRD